MTQAEAQSLTHAARARIQTAQAQTAAVNLHIVVTKLIPEAANKGYGSLLIGWHKLLAPEHQQLKKLGYKLRAVDERRWLQIGWDRRAAKKNYSGHAGSGQLQCLPD